MNGFRTLNHELQLQVGVKADPIQYRFSYEWLFGLMEEEGVTRLQFSTFFEAYHLPDEYFEQLRAAAERFGIRIRSVFTAHRELGGFFRPEPGWEQAARRNYERLIEIGALLGAQNVGTSPGTVLRDRMDEKDAGIACYLRHMKELMVYAREKGLDRLTIEPMSCLAEPPTLPDEIRAMAEALMAFHHAHADTTTPVGYCTDVAHGYADRDGNVRWDNMELLGATIPYLAELHLKNTDALFASTFGFGEEERSRGIVEIPAVVGLLMTQAVRLPVRELIGYLELGGPKLGRDYSDWRLDGQLRDSLRYVVRTFRGDGE